MKKILILLFSLFVGLLTFCNAENYSNTVQSITLSVNSGYNYDGFMCIGPTNSNCGKYTVIYINGVQVGGFPNGQNHQRLWCGNGNINFVNGHTQGYDCTYNVYIFSGFDLNCPVCEECPEVDTGSILSGSCDTNYCVENDLCPVASNFSQLFINNIEFPGKPLINVDIPDYIYWDYSSSDSGYDIYVGSGYDEDYINSIVDINSYRPTSEDFTSIFVNGLTLIFPYLIFTIFLVFMWKLIKRIFKH